MHVQIRRPHAVGAVLSLLCRRASGPTESMHRAHEWFGDPQSAEAGRISRIENKRIFVTLGGAVPHFYGEF